MHAYMHTNMQSQLQVKTEEVNMLKKELVNLKSQIAAQDKAAGKEPVEVFIYLYTYICTCICMHAWKHECMHTPIHECDISAYMYIYIRAYIYIRTYIRVQTR